MLEKQAKRRVNWTCYDKKARDFKGNNEIHYARREQFWSLNDLAKDSGIAQITQ